MTPGLFFSQGTCRLKFVWVRQVSVVGILSRMVFTPVFFTVVDILLWAHIQYHFFLISCEG